MVFLLPELQELVLEPTLCTKHISIKDINTRKDPNLQAVVAAAAAAAAVVVIK
jgi:hypothetical protein